MSVCGLLTRTLILAFFALNAYNRFTSATADSQKFKADYTQFVGTFQTKTGLQLPAQLQASFITNYSYEIVYYGAIAQLVLSILGLFCGCFSGLAGVLYFTCQFIQLNYFALNWKSTVELEKYALPIALLVASFLASCCGSSCKKTNKDKAQAERKRGH